MNSILRSSLARTSLFSHHRSSLFISSRGFAKKSNKGAASSAGDESSSTANNSEQVLELLTSSKEKMKTHIERFETKLESIRSEGAHPDVVAKIAVSAAGKNVWLPTLGLITVPSPLKLTIQLNDRTLTPAVEKAIMGAGLNLTPKGDAHLGIVDVTFPRSTREQREQKAKAVSAELEKNKVVLRSLRQDALKKMKALKLSEDEQKGNEKKLMTMTKAAETKMEETAEAKKKALVGSAEKGQVVEDEW